MCAVLFLHPHDCRFQSFECDQSPGPDGACCTPDRRQRQGKILDRQISLSRAVQTPLPVGKTKGFFSQCSEKPIGR
ncbi:hypothetical protein D3C87_2104240 [compost metagenome]